MSMSTQFLKLREKIKFSAVDGGRKPSRQTRSLLHYLFTSTRGGPARLNIIMILLETPCNTCQLSQRLHLDYKTIQHHVRVLEKNNMITKSGKKYGAVFQLSVFLEMNIGELDAVIDKIERKANRKKTYI